MKSTNTIRLTNGEDYHLLKNNLIENLPDGIRLNTVENEKTVTISLHVAAGYQITEPLHLQLAPLSALEKRDLCFNILLEEGSRLFLIDEQHYAQSTEVDIENNILNNLMSIALHANLKKKSYFEYVKLQTLPKTISCKTAFTVEQAQGSELHAGFFHQGAQLSEERVRIIQQGAQASSHLYGLFTGTLHGQRNQQDIEIRHLATDGASSMLYKNILDQQSAVDLRGKVFVEKNAQRINASQALHSLLLSPTAEAACRPELEIYADDVKCAHGATVGQLDTDALFYLRTRGLSAIDARQMLMQAFAAEIFEKIPSSKLLNFLLGKMGYLDAF